MPTIGGDLDVFPLSLGTNVFGWTSDERDSFAVLDAYVAAGGNFLDTAALYGGGASETIIGDWMAARGNRDQLVIATKGGWKGGLGEASLTADLDASLARLRTDRIDLYYVHRDDPETSPEETVRTLDAFVRAGKVRHVAASNLSPARLAESLAVAERDGLARYVALQPHYNLVERARFERDHAALVAREGIATLPYYALARGFLTGKYRPSADTPASPRAEGASVYLDARGIAVLEALDAIAAAHETTVAAVALAWLLAQPTVAAPIASARTPAQLADLLPMAELRLSDAELAQLDTASS